MPADQAYEHANENAPFLQPGGLPEVVAKYGVFFPAQVSI